MCGIFGFVVSKEENPDVFELKQAMISLLKLSERRGKDTCGLAVANDCKVHIFRQTEKAAVAIKSRAFVEFLNSLFKLNKNTLSQSLKSPFAVLGHCRLVTNGSHVLVTNNHPLEVGNTIGVHNGIVTNAVDLLGACKKDNNEVSFESINSESDTAILYRLINEHINVNGNIVRALSEVYNIIKGSASIAFFNKIYPALYIATNTGSLHYSYSEYDKFFAFASERYILEKFLKRTKLNSSGKLDIKQLSPMTAVLVNLDNVMPKIFSLDIAKQSVYKYKDEECHKCSPYVVADPASTKKILRKCSRCILPESYPFIVFDKNGVCNYCNNHKSQLSYGREALENILSRYRSKDGSPDCLVGLSGGRDSCYGLHILKREFGMHPIAYTYDWGLTTDYSRMNQALVCGKLEIEHIIRAADITQKRRDIKNNINAWLKKPELGMVPIFFAGDKPFIYYGGELLKETGLKLSIHCTGSQLEQMEFKIGFCGVNQSLKSNQQMFTYKAVTKIRLALWYGYQFLRSPGYLMNGSFFDNMFAFYCSFLYPDKTVSLYHYIPWDENIIEETLEREYGWFRDKRYGSNQWRMDDGQTAFTNYIYYTVAGFSEFDAFRSNQVRSGLLTRKEASMLAEEDNRPRYEALQAFSQLIGFNLEDALKRINSIPKLY